MDKERKYKEMGAKIYEVLLHLFAIGGLVMAIDGSGFFNQYFKLFGLNEMWWGWLLLTGLAMLRLYILDRLKAAANKEGMLLTEFTDKIKEEQNKE